MKINFSLRLLLKLTFVKIGVFYYRITLQSRLQVIVHIFNWVLIYFTCLIVKWIIKVPIFISIIPCLRTLPSLTLLIRDMFCKASTACFFHLCKRSPIFFSFFLLPLRIFNILVWFPHLRSKLWSLCIINHKRLI